MKIDLIKESKFQFRRMTRRFAENAKGAFVAVLALFCYGMSSLPCSTDIHKILQNSSEEVAFPNSKLLIFGMLSYCVCLLFSGWPVMDAFKRYLARPYLNFFFDLCSLASGAVLAVLLTEIFSKDIGKLTAIISIYVVALFFMGAIIWLGIYLTGERFDRLSKSISLDGRSTSPLRLEPSSSPFT